VIGQSEYESVVIKAASTCAKTNFDSLISNSEMFDFAGPLSSKIFTVWPVREEPLIATPTLIIPTSYLAAVYSDALFREASSLQVSFYMKCSKFLALRGTARWLYENYCHFLFSSHGRHCSLPTSPEALIPVPIAPETTGGRTMLRNLPSNFVTPFYWRPRNANFAGIDALIHVGDTVWALQYMISSRHSSAINDFKELRDCIGHRRQVSNWHLVIVAPELNTALVLVDRERRTEASGDWPALKIFACQVEYGLFSMKATQAQVVETMSSRGVRKFTFTFS
jgi:hypothetical protein